MTASVTTPAPSELSTAATLPAEDLSELLAAGHQSRRALNPRLLILSLLPFWLVPAAHVISNPDTASGFFHYELPYYVANGRAAFDRGDGVFYPNPYYPSDAAPSIYAHWVPWTFGLAVAKFGFDPGDLILAATFFASIAFAYATNSLVQVRTQTAEEGSRGYLLAMLGGGLLVLAGGFITMLRSGEWADVLMFDPGRGLWFLNWGRNALFPTEAIYHSLVAGCWLMEIKRRHRWSNTFLVLLATTHPWSGIELLCTMNLWRLLDFAIRRSRTARTQLSISVVVMIAFLAYYKVWLPSFPSHAQLQRVWELNWSLNGLSALLAYGPLVLPAAVAVRRAIIRDGLNAAEQFLCCALLVAVGLAFHDRLIRPVQPLHFTRGYVWMPLFLLGLPVTLEWIRNIGQRRGPAVVSVVVLLAAVDNFGFAAVHVHEQWTAADGFHLDGDERVLLAEIDDVVPNAVVLSESDALNYLFPTYAHVRPWLGHRFNTPDYNRRLEQKQAVFADGTINLDRVPDDVDVLVLRSSRNAQPLIASNAWNAIDCRNAGWRLWRRVIATP
ncbi:MAG: hypothetical protein Fues2KO_54010 [Fuerstiella sp.]